MHHDPTTDDTATTHVLIVTDGSDSAAHATAIAAELFPTADLEIMTAFDVARDVYEGSTGFAGPVVGDDELTEIERARRVEAMGTTAGTARVLGRRPARLTQQEGEPDVAVGQVVRWSDPDVVVIAADSSSPTSGELIDELDRPVLVIPPAQQRQRH